MVVTVTYISCFIYFCLKYYLFAKHSMAFRLEWHQIEFTVTSISLSIRWFQIFTTFRDRVNYNTFTTCLWMYIYMYIHLLLHVYAIKLIVCGLHQTKWVNYRENKSEKQNWSVIKAFFNCIICPWYLACNFGWIITMYLFLPSFWSINSNHTVVVHYSTC